jgi:hypothetical protein
MFCAPGLIFGGTEGVGSHFHASRAGSFSAVPMASGPIFIFCAPGIIFGGTEVVRSRFHVLRSQTCFQRCRVRWVTFSCFVRPEWFRRPEDDGSRFHVFRTGTIFSGTEGIGSNFHVFFAPGVISRDTEGVGSRFQVLRSRTHFR